MATSPLLLAAGGAAVGVAAGGPVGAAIGAAAGLILGLATGGEAASSPITTGGSPDTGGMRLIELLDPNGDKYALPKRAIDWLYGGEIDIRPPANASGWAFWTEKLGDADSSAKVLRAYRLARGCSPTSDRYAVWSRFAIQFANAKAFLDGIDPSRRQEAFSTLIGIGLRGSDLSDLTEAESFWTSQAQSLASFLYFAGLQRLPVTLGTFQYDLTPGILAAMIQSAGEKAQDCDIVPGRGMSCDGSLEVDTTDYLCKGLPGAACTLDGKSGAFDRLGLCVIPEPPPDPLANKVAYQGTTSTGVAQTTYSCAPGFDWDAASATCVSTAPNCPEGQFYNALGQCVDRQQQQTTVGAGGQIQVNQPTLSQTSAGQIGASIPGAAGLAPVLPAAKAPAVPSVPTPIPSAFNRNTPIVTTIPGSKPVLQIKPFAAAPITRFANMGIGLPRRRG